MGIADVGSLLSGVTALLMLRLDVAMAPYQYADHTQKRPQVSLMYDFSGGDCDLEEGLARERIDLLAAQIGGITSA